jgi:cell division septation protein DedD
VSVGAACAAVEQPGRPTGQDLAFVGDVDTWDAGGVAGPDGDPAAATSTPPASQRRCRSHSTSATSAASTAMPAVPPTVVTAIATAVAAGER